jgi:hypothetical protein
MVKRRSSPKKKNSPKKKSMLGQSPSNVTTSDGKRDIDSKRIRSRSQSTIKRSPSPSIKRSLSNQSIKRSSSPSRKPNRTLPRKFRVVVSLTTIPERIDVLYKTLINIYDQTYLPDIIYLNVPRKYKDSDKNVVIPEDLYKLICTSKIHIYLNLLDKDYGPGTKLYPTLLIEKDKDTRIITIDDDSIYDKNMIKVLVNESAKFPNKAIAFYGWNIGAYENRFQRSFFKDYGTKMAPGNIDILEGFGGAVYRVGLFSGKVKSFINTMLKGPRECFFVDDVWISAWLWKNGIDVYLMKKPKGMKYPESHTPGTKSLSENPNKILRNSTCALYYKDRHWFKNHV